MLKGLRQKRCDGSRFIIVNITESGIHGDHFDISTLPTQGEAADTNPASEDCTEIEIKNCNRLLENKGNKSRESVPPWASSNRSRFLVLDLKGILVKAGKDKGSAVAEIAPLQTVKSKCFISMSTLSFGLEKLVVHH